MDRSTMKFFRLCLVLGKQARCAAYAKHIAESDAVPGHRSQGFPKFEPEWAFLGV
jgi:hypothetical protein